MSDWLVRDVRPADAPVLGWIHVESWRAAYRGIVSDAHLDGLDPGRRGREWLRWIVEAGPDRILVVERVDDGALVGFASVGTYRPNPDAETDDLSSAHVGELRSLYLDPMVWGSGVADVILPAARDALVALGFADAALWAFEDNPRARRFYERHGWATDGARLTFAIDGGEVAEVRYRKVLHARPPL